MLSAIKQDQLVDKWVDSLSIKIGASNDVSTLSGRPTCRAKWLATTPKLLILDSQTVGVDVAQGRGYLRLFIILLMSLSILLISDEISEVLMNSDRVPYGKWSLAGEYLPNTTKIEALEAIVYA